MGSLSSGIRRFFTAIGRGLRKSFCPLVRRQVKLVSALSSVALYLDLPQIINILSSSRIEANRRGRCCRGD